MADFHYSQFILKLNIKIEMNLIKSISSIASDNKMPSSQILYYLPYGNTTEVIIYKS